MDKPHVGKALATAMAEAGLDDSQVATKARVSFWTVRSIRLGLTRKPFRVTLAALKEAVPGFAELLDAERVA